MNQSIWSSLLVFLISYCRSVNLEIGNFASSFLESSSLDRYQVSSRDIVTKTNRSLHTVWVVFIDIFPRSLNMQSKRKLIKNQTIRTLTSFCMSFELLLSKIIIVLCFLYHFCSPTRSVQRSSQAYFLYYFRILLRGFYWTKSSQFITLVSPVSFTSWKRLIDYM